MKLLWEGTLSAGGSATVPELPYYTIVAMGLGDRSRLGFAHIYDRTAAITLFPSLIVYDANTHVQLAYAAACRLTNGTVLTMLEGKAMNLYSPSSWITTTSIYSVYGVL